jgi:hypothetical protein
MCFTLVSVYVHTVDLVTLANILKFPISTVALCRFGESKTHKRCSAHSKQLIPAKPAAAAVDATAALATAAMADATAAMAAATAARVR